MRARVLIVEDEESISTPLRESLEREGFDAIVASTGGEGLRLAEREPPDIVLLDLMLPDLDGREVCRRIRERSSVPIVMLTARGEEADRVLGLELGADDYVVKPFSARELAARVRAVLRRGRPSGYAAAPIVLGDVQVDEATRTVQRRGEVVAMTAREFDLFAFLARNAGRVVRREEIIDEVWDPNWYGPTKTLDVHISWLRRKLEDDPSSPRLIRTVRGVGFIVDAPERP